MNSTARWPVDVLTQRRNNCDYAKKMRSGIQIICKHAISLDKEGHCNGRVEEPEMIEPMTSS